MHGVRGVLLVVMTSLVLAACGGGSGDGEVRWRDLTWQVPQGWTVFEDEETRFAVANVPLGAERDDDEPRPDGEVFAVFATHRPGVGPADWRDYVAATDGIDLLEETSTEVGGVPATRFELDDTRSGHTRETVVVVPAREIEILAQPVPLDAADADLTAVYDTFADELDAMLGSARFGAPVDGPSRVGGSD